MSHDIPAVDAVVNLWTAEALSHRPEGRGAFYRDKMRVKDDTFDGVELDEMLRRMDAAGIERAFLIAHRCGPEGPRACWRLPYELVAAAVARHPDRFHALAGIDPTEGMRGVRAFEHAVREFGFIGAHGYPHWFGLAPDNARWYPFYAKCVELDVPIQLQVGQSMIYAEDYPCESVGRPIALDPVACHFPELRLIGIHVGIPWADEMIAMAWKHKNVFIGTDAHSPKYWPENFVRFLDSYGRDKAIFGTDFPVLDFARTRAEFDALPVRNEARRMVLRENALRIYGLG